MTKLIDLNLCFPEPNDPSIPRGPLPKQALFLNLALAEGKPKYIRYIGGLGSGKSLVGCITVLSWAVRHQGDYLIGRYYMPELRATTYKTFLEICPPELIKEHRVAEAIVRIKCANGGYSNVMFRGMEEPEKHKSLNLNGFYLDEANQCTEAGFMLLQGRLRGRYVRKGIITQNSGGHDWTWRWFVQKDHIKEERVRQEFVSIKAPSTENVHLPDGYVQNMLDTWSAARVAREVHGDEDSFEGQVFVEFKPTVHVTQPYDIPKHWTRVVGADHGFRNPAAWIWGAIDEDGNIVIYREFYQKEWIIEQIVHGNKELKEPGVLSLQKGENVQAVYIDPSVNAKRSSRNGIPYSNWDEYIEALPDGFPLLQASNDVKSSINRIKEYLRVDEKSGQPSLKIFNTCTNLIDEMINYRWQELRSTQDGKRDEREDPVKYYDHAVDGLRYLIMSRPEKSKILDLKRDLKYTQAQAALIKEIEMTRISTHEGDPFESQ